MTKAKEAESTENVEMVTINGDALPGMELKIPRALHDKLLNRYADVTEWKAIGDRWRQTEKEIIGLMHLHQSHLPKDENGDPFLVFNGISHTLTRGGKEKIKQAKIADED